MNGNKKAVSLYQNSNETRCRTILAYITDINRQSFEWAQQVGMHPDLRPSYAVDVSVLIDSLLSLAKELEQADPDLYKLHLDFISEALQDLNFIQTGSLN